MSALDDILEQTDESKPAAGRPPTAEDKVKTLLQQTGQTAPNEDYLAADSLRFINSEYKKAGIPPIDPQGYLAPSELKIYQSMMANEASPAAVPKPSAAAQPAKTTPPPNPAKKGDVFIAATRSGYTGLLQGMLSPFGSLIPQTWEKLVLQREEDKKKLLGYMSSDEASKSVVNMSPKVKQAIAAAPGVTGEFAGSIVPGAPIVTSTKKLSQVVTKSKVLQRVVSGVSAGTAFTALSEVSDGESRTAKVAAASLQMGMLETGLGLFSRANREELGSAYTKVVQRVAQKTNRPVEQVEQDLTMLRAGPGMSAKDVDTAEALLTSTGDLPVARVSPVVRNAQQRWEAMMRKVVPENMHHDPLLAQADPNYGVKFSVYIDGQKTPGLDFAKGQKAPTPDFWHIPSDPNNPAFFSNTLGMIRKHIADSIGQGHDVKIDDVYYGHRLTGTRFRNFLLGKQADGQPTKPPIPGAAPVNTYAEQGGVPPSGSTVTVTAPGAAPVKRTVITAEQPKATRPEEFTFDKSTEETPATASNDLPVSDQKAHPKPTKPAPKGSVWTMDPMTGKTELTPLSQIRVALQKPGGAFPSASEEGLLQPHPDGTPRNAIVHINERSPENHISFEPWGAPLDEKVNLFRSEFFKYPDIDADFGHDPRLFIGKDNVTISVTPGERIWTPRQFGPLGDFGVTDSVQYSGDRALPKLRSTAGGKRATGDIFAAEPDTEYTPFKPTAGFVPRAQRTEFGRPGQEVHIPVEEDLRTMVPRPPEEPPPVIPESMTVKQGYLKKSGSKRRTTTEFDQATPDELPESYGIGPDFIGHPEIVTAQRAAQVLLKKGAPADTPVFVRAAYDQHVHVDKDPQWTLQTLADYEPRLISLERLHDEATPRGINVIPQGKGVTLHADDGSWKKTFDTQLEAADFVLRQPSGRIPAQRLESPLEGQMGMGFSRTFDADKDASIFLPTNLQEAATQELVRGQRPLITLYSEKPWQVQQAVQALEKQARLPQGTFDSLLLPQGGKRVAVAVYDRRAVQQSVETLKPLIARLGVDPTKSTEDVIRQLSTKKWGLEAFANRVGAPGRNPEDALYYTWLRERGLKEAWEQGRLAGDALGTYRVYDPATKGNSGFFYQGAGDEIPPPTGVNMSDMMHAFPDDARMYAQDTPPMFEPEPHLTDEWLRTPDFKQEGGPLAKIGRFFRVPEELMKDWQTKTGVPFWDWYRTIEEARSTLEGNFGPFQQSVRQLFKGVPKELRTQANLVFEAKMSGEGYADLVKVADPQAVKIADTAEKVWKEWLGSKYGYTPEQVEEFFGEFPQVRKSDGNFLDYSKGRGKFPELMTLTSKQFRSGVIKSDGREQDLYRVMMRVGRAISNARDLEPAWETAKNGLSAYQVLGSMSQDNMMYFEKYMREVVHMPDSIAVTMARLTNQISEKLAGKKVISDPESFDLVSTLVGANYFANMAWNPGLVMRNLLQTLQTSSSLGVAAWAKGVKMVSKWRNDPAFEEELIQRGILTRDLQSQQFADVSEAMAQIQDAVTNTLPKKMKGAYDKFHEYGTRWYKSADDVNRIIAYYAQHDVAIKTGEKYLAGKIDFQQYLKQSMIDMRGPAGGPLEQLIQHALEQGENEAAAHIAATDYMRATQFVYRRGTAPYWMMNTPGRLLGQYGTWPSYFAELFRNTLLRGSVENRVKASARWAATNYVMYETAKNAFGVDASKWLFFAPLGYTGGPFVQIGYDATQAFNQAVNGTKDPAATIATSRLKSAWTQFTPGVPVGGIRHAIQALDAIGQEDYATATKRFLGMPPAK